MEGADMEDYGIEFREELEAIISGIPEGKTATLKAVACALGDSRAARAIPGLLDEIDGPVWRLVRSDGSVLDNRLGDEVPVRDGRAYAPLMEDLGGPGILRRLREEQIAMASEVDTKDRHFSSITGVDIGYRQGRALVALSSFDLNGGHLWDEVMEERVTFPYISTYLSYREGPPILKAMEDSGHDIEALMIDGNGILHPEHLGLASYVGIKAGIPSIGVAKTLLCGSLQWLSERKAKVIIGGETVAWAVIGGRAKNPVYISPGNMISLESSLKVTERFMRHRVPEPTRRAHMLASGQTIL